MKLYEFYNVDKKSIIYVYDKYDDSGGMRYFCIFFGISNPPTFTSLYETERESISTKEDIKNILENRYNAIIRFVFEASANGYRF